MTKPREDGSTRRDRLAQELRENLKRRKTKARAEQDKPKGTKASPVRGQTR